jgi:hypothetical protein
MRSFSSWLFASPSFLEGFCRSLDFCGTLTEFNRSRSGVEADMRALRSDWLALGQDFQQVRRARVEGAHVSKPQPPKESPGK